jgi:hypothetical protein
MIDGPINRRRDPETSLVIGTGVSPDIGRPAAASRKADTSGLA